jgi:TatD DNase family protein
LNSKCKEEIGIHDSVTMIIDTHAHLDLPQFDTDRPDVIQRAREAGLASILTIAMASPERTSLARTIDLVEKYDLLFAAAGIHPHDARAASRNYLDELSRWMEHPKVILLGEIGLDYHYKNSPKDKQKDAFRMQLQFAREKNIPVAIHCREAWQDLFEILEQESKGKKFDGILHNFTGGPELAERCVSFGLMISFSGILTFGGSEDIRNAAKSLRLDQILVETDSPYVSPVPHRALRNEPKFILDVARMLARVKGVTVDDIIRNTTFNFHSLIGETSKGSGEVLVYAIRDRLYVNLTNRCSCRCIFCRRETEPIASGYDLHLENELPVRDYLLAIGEPRRYAEIVFCGFGEPTLRLDELVELSRILKSQGTRLRLNTNGHGNLINGRNIIPEIAPYLDEISISIDAPDPGTYLKVVRPDYGNIAFQAVIDFTKACVGVIPIVTLTAVDIPAVDLDACRRLAQELNVQFRVRKYQPMVGSTDFTNKREMLKENAPEADNTEESRGDSPNAQG